MSTREAQLERTVAEKDAIIAELRDLVAALQTENEQQKISIDRLVKMTFGRSSERHIGPTLFDGIEPPAEAEVPPPPQNDLDIPAQTARRRSPAALSWSR